MQTKYCWHCSRVLVKVMNPKSEHRGQVSYRQLQLKTGETVQVHHTCYTDAVKDQRVITADIPSTGRYIE